MSVDRYGFLVPTPPPPLNPSLENTQTTAWLSILRIGSSNPYRVARSRAFSSRIKRDGVPEALRGYVWSRMLLEVDKERAQVGAGVRGEREDRGTRNGDAVKEREMQNVDAGMAREHREMRAGEDREMRAGEDRETRNGVYAEGRETRMELMDKRKTEEGRVEERMETSDDSKNENHGIAGKDKIRVEIVKHAETTALNAANDVEKRSGESSAMTVDATDTDINNDERADTKVTKGIPATQFKPPTRSSYPPSPHHEAIDAIDKDLKRTYPMHRYFRTVLGQEALRHVLESYAEYDPQVGYCQGMSFIAALFLLYVPETDALCMLRIVMKKSFWDLRELFLPPMNGVKLKLHIFDCAMKKFAPVMFARLKFIGIESNMYATQWIMTIFTYSFPFELIVRLWDLFLIQGWSLVFGASVAFWRMHQSEFVGLQFEEIFEHLKSALRSDNFPLTRVNQFMRDALYVSGRITRGNWLDKWAAGGISNQQQ